MITFMGHMIPMDGYGYSTIQIADALRRLEPETRVLDMCPEPEKFAPFDSIWQVAGETVALCTPDWLPCIVGASRILSYTMFEASKLPEGWARAINVYARECLVPSQWCKDMFIENGVSVPVRVVLWGINPAHWYPLERIDHDGPYVFLWSGTQDWRKGWDVAYKAFIRAFGRSRKCRLHLHFRYPLRGNPAFRDPNVTVTVGMVERQVMRGMLQAADCFVFPSRGEGWGNPPREAAATGLPVIATQAGGLSEELESWGIGLQTRGMSRASYGFWTGADIGEWFEPDPDHLVELMRWCFENREDAARVGARAASWLSGVTWDRTAHALLVHADEEVLCESSM